MSAGQARQLLGVEAGADAQALARAYRAAVKAAHPDREGGDAERLRAVIEAHRLLTAVAETRLRFAPARREPERPSAARPGPKVLRLQITLAEAVLGGERRIEPEPGRQLDVRLPPGLRPGESLRLAGAAAGGGDLLLRIILQAEPAVQVRGSDLWLDVTAPEDEVREGVRMEVDTPRGRRAFLAPRIAEGGGLIRIKGEGLPARAGHPAGDLIVRLALVPSEESRSRQMLKRFSARWAA